MSEKVTAYIATLDPENLPALGNLEQIASLLTSFEATLAPTNIVEAVEPLNKYLSSGSTKAVVFANNEETFAFDVPSTDVPSGDDGDVFTVVPDVFRRLWESLGGKGYPWVNHAGDRYPGRP